jgi:uncharacterized phiE125 gp8 family phage protein
MTRKLERITAPAEPFLKIDEIMAHLRIDSDDELIYLAQLRDSVERALDAQNGITGRALVTQQWRKTVDSFAALECDYLDFPPTIAIDAIKYIDTNDILQTVAAVVWGSETRRERTRPRLKAGQSWPNDLSSEPGSVMIEWTAGYGAATAVPANIKHAGLLMIGLLYENRESHSQGGKFELSPSISWLLDPYRINENAVTHE